MRRRSMDPKEENQVKLKNLCVDSRLAKDEEHVVLTAALRVFLFQVFHKREVG